MTNEKYNPIPKRRFRFPGESLSLKISEIIDETQEWVVLLALVWLVAVTEFLRAYTPSRPHPWFWITAALGTTLWCAVKIYQTRQQVRRFRLGMTGERYVGRLLEDQLIPHGYHVFHDVQGRIGNIDHLVIGPSGVFTIETKTRSKRQSDQKVSYDGTKVLVDGFEPDRDPISQALMQKQWVGEQMNPVLGKLIPIQPVVVYPEWFVSPGPSGAKVWVLNEKWVASSVRKHAITLSPDEISALVAFMKSRTLPVD